MHVLARKQCIFCCELHVGHKSYLKLPYATSLRDSFCLGTLSARLYYAVASQPRVFARLLVANIFNVK